MKEDAEGTCVTSIQGPFCFTVSTHEYTRNRSTMRRASTQLQYLLFFAVSGMAGEDRQGRLREVTGGGRGDAAVGDCVTTLFVAIQSYAIESYGRGLGN
jgi:hypothetical protein